MTETIKRNHDFKRACEMTGKIKTHGGKRVGAGRKRAEIEAVMVKARFEQPGQTEAYKDLETPLKYMLAVMRDPHADFRRRDDMAKAAAPYCHRKMADTPIGKKERAEADAQTAGVGSEWEDDLAFIASTTAKN
jgi:hypothetical protein